MKTDRVLALLYLLTTLFCSCSLPPDEDDEESVHDDISYKLPWTGETHKFTISAKEGIHLNDPEEESGTAYVSTPSSNVRNVRWEFGVRLTFNPSANNYARFYLASSSNMLSGDLNGYFLQIGGAKDNVALYRQDGNQPILLGSGRELMKENSSPKLYIKVECDKNGYWTFWTRLESETGYTKEKQVKDTHIKNSVCCGIYCVYTKTRCDGFTFHHIQLSNNVETTTDPDDTPDDPEEPDQPDQPDYPADVRNLLLLNEVMYDHTSDGAEYIELYNPSDSTVTIQSLRFLRYTDSGTTKEAILQHPDGNRKISVPSHGYICFTKSANKLIRKHKVDGKTILEVATFPPINNEGGYLAIATNEEKSRLIDKCSYYDAMHTGEKGKKGVSLEKRSPELASSLDANWHSSKDATGGTPGIKNSQE